jgi:hypothetical protein
MKKLGAFLAICVVTTGTAAALDLQSGPYTFNGDGLGAFDCDGETKWDQLPDGASGLSSQDDQCYPFNSQVADNFMGDGGDVTGFGWWGLFWNGSPINATDFRVSIWASDADGCPGELVCENVVSAVQTDEGGGTFSYCANFPACPKEAGVSYHIGAQAIFCFPPQWGYVSGAGDGQECCFRGELFGFPDWVTATTVFGIPYELSGVIYNGGGGGTPVEDASWSAVKDLYR